MSPPNVPTKEGEPASEILSNALQILGALEVEHAKELTHTETWTEVGALQESLERARVRAVAQEAEGRRLREALEEVLGHLPDSVGHGADWDWCWNELFSDSQEKVKTVRERARAALSGSSETFPFLPRVP